MAFTAVAEAIASVAEVLGWAFSESSRASVARRWSSGGVERVVLVGQVAASVSLAALLVIVVIAWLWPS